MVSLAELPVEIKRLIVKELKTTDLKRVCLVSREFSSIVIPILYSTIRLKPHHKHGIDLYQKENLFNSEHPNPHLKHIRDLQVIHPDAGRKICPSTIDYINKRVQPSLRENQLHSLSLCSSLDAGPDVLPFLIRNRNLRALRLNVPPPCAYNIEYFNYLGLHHYNLRALSLQFLNTNPSDRQTDFTTLNKLLCKLQNLHSLDLKFRELQHRPVQNPPLWPDAVRLLDTIFAMKSLRELSLLGNDIPIGYWAEANPSRRVGKNLTLFRSEAVDRGDADRRSCDRDDLFWFNALDMSKVKRFQHCLGVIYFEKSIPDQVPRYLSRNNNLQSILADCEQLEEFRCCNLPQIPDFDPSNHCFFRVKDTLRRLRICSSDWYGMDDLPGFLTEEQHQEREKSIISELNALQILELTVNWPRWYISSKSIQLVHILREPRYNPADFDSDDEDEDEDDTLDALLKVPTRALFLQARAQQFAKITQPKFLPSLKVVVFSKTNLFREHCHTRRFEGIQGDREEYLPLAYSVEMEGESDLPYGVAEPLSFKEMEEQFPWLYDGVWEGKFWDESRGYRFW
ncbi:hypothetical protein TWF970_000069 [Orbilia oligospora]|uniref:F-box domain-containing protein n=1 Tax=Orbilia oligospora TaxID=2813651 RepID=A0A7C8VFS9_ORBOL|nr:hypothetical protein TWF970_000069 [Orbilia oligospora]